MDSSRRERVELLGTPLGPHGLDTITDALVAHMTAAASQGHPLGFLLSPAGVCYWLAGLQEAGRLDVFVQGRPTPLLKIVGVLGWDIGEIPWAPSRSVLKELTAFTVDPGFKGFGRIVLERLQELAKANHCDLIEAGGALCVDPAPLKNLYMGHGGFQWSYPNFVKIL